MVLLEQTPICVDEWRHVAGARVFFLTHAHADHTEGLSAAFPHPIHCSPITKRILMHKFAIPSSQLIELEVGERRIVRLDSEGQVTMCVTAIDANHCPGAIMLLFQGYFGNILCTGDFRYSSAMLPYLQSIHIDLVYLDTTFANPIFSFPTRVRGSSAVGVCCAPAIPEMCFECRKNAFTRFWILFAA
eukprot:m.219811 g.219811  ORF g.219811 m.219811 type:complete len:188 (+) comp54140_c0_seq1:83-646(+)